MEEQEPSGVVAMYKEREQQDPLGFRTIPNANRTTRQVRGPAWFYDLRSVRLATTVRWKQTTNRFRLKDPRNCPANLLHWYSFHPTAAAKA